jgi:hypothetical protein
MSATIRGPNRATRSGGRAVIETTALDGATLVRLNRPPVNALDIELNEAIASTFRGCTVRSC